MMCQALRSVSLRGRTMSERLWLLLTLLTLPHCGRSQTLHQTPSFISLPPNSSVQLDCYLQGYSSTPWMYWYRQPPQGGALHMLFLSRGEGLTDDSSEKHFKAARPTEQNFTLSTDSLFPNHTGLYYCAWSEQQRTPQYFGEGTRLTVLEDLSKISDPEVAIFPPSKQEIKEKRKATLVCLATNFYPDHIKLVWQVNGVERKEGVRTEESLLDNYKEKYSLTSRLRISHQEWSNPKNTFQCFVEFYGNETKPYNKVINGVADCSVSEESYLRSAMASKSVYVLLIFKSALYGVFVMGLMLRNKQVQ